MWFHSSGSVITRSVAANAGYHFYIIKSNQPLHTHGLVNNTWYILCDPAGMLEIKFIRQILVFAFAAAIAYCIMVFFYIQKMTYEETFILYVGNFLFAAVIGIFISWFYKQHERAVSSVRMVVVGAKTAVAGIVMACILALLMVLVFAPSAFKSAAVAHAQLQDAPGQFGGKNRGFGSILFFNAVLGNMGASFFISLLIPFAVMKNLYEDEKRGKPATTEENPKKNYDL